MQLQQIYSNAHTHTPTHTQQDSFARVNHVVFFSDVVFFLTLLLLQL